MKTKEEKQFSFIGGTQTQFVERDVLSAHIIPNFAKDNVALLSQTSFLDITKEEVERTLGAVILKEEIAISHPIKGRIPEAKYKKVNELLPTDTTEYYERMGFVYHLEKPAELDIPNMSFVCGGIKAYNLDNLASKSNSPQTFKLFIGTQNGLCLNLTIFGQGFAGEIKVRDEDELRAKIKQMFMHYNLNNDIEYIRKMQAINLSYVQVKNFIGNARMINAMPAKMQKDAGIVEMPLQDGQLLDVCRGYWTDVNFRCNPETKDISLWNFYNLLTGANKTSYLDTFSDRNTMCTELVRNIVDKEDRYLALLN